MKHASLRQAPEDQLQQRRTPQVPTKTLERRASEEDDLYPTAGMSTQSTCMERASIDIYGINYDDPPPPYTEVVKGPPRFDECGRTKTDDNGKLPTEDTSRSKDRKWNGLSDSILNTAKSNAQRLHKSFAGLCEDVFNCGLFTEEAIRGGRTPLKEEHRFFVRLDCIISSSSSFAYYGGFCPGAERFLKDKKLQEQWEKVSTFDCHNQASVPRRCINYAMKSSSKILRCPDCLWSTWMESELKWPAGECQCMLPWNISIDLRSKSANSQSV